MARKPFWVSPSTGAFAGRPQISRRGVSLRRGTLTIGAVLNKRWRRTFQYIHGNIRNGQPDAALLIWINVRGPIPAKVIAAYNRVESKRI